MYINIENFDKPVAFYAYTSMVMSTILEVSAVNYRMFGEDDLTDDEHEIMDYILSLFVKADKLHRNNGYVSTGSDNKTVIEMSDHSGHHLFFGYKDCRFFIGLDVYTEADNRKIDLSDISSTDWSKLGK